MPTNPRGVRQRQRFEAAWAAAVGRLTAVLPALGEHDAAAALVAAGPVTVRILEQLAVHLGAHPDALTSGSSACPLVVLRLTRVLRQGGHAVTRPGCARCGKVTVQLNRLAPAGGPAGGRICGTCDNQTRRGRCARCGREGVRIAARRQEGVICHGCYRSDPQTFEACGGCGQLGAPVARLADGSARCKRCWTRPTHPCVCCGKLRAAALVDLDGALCHYCYNHQRRPRRPCGRCGRLRIVARAATGDQPDLCNGCYRGPEATCSGCGRTRPCNRNKQGEPVCQSCYQPPSDTCCRCHRIRRINARWPMGPVCESCYTVVLRSPARCARCRTIQPLIARDDNGTGICGPCVGFAVDYTCRTCGRAGWPYGTSRCAYCVLADRLRQLLAGPDGTVSAQLQPLADALAQVDAPFSAIRWITVSPTGRLLARLAADGQQLSHGLLDELPPSRNLHYSRQLLVHTGVLPERLEDLERLPSWLEHLLADGRATHANLLRPFLHWFLLRRARHRAAVRRYPAAAGRDLRRRVLVALELLTWLDEQDLALADLHQDHIDRWLSAGSTSRYRIRSFLAWTAARGLTRTLTVPTLPRQQPVELLDEDDRWGLLQRCLTDETIPLDVRAAGALTLLFGLPSQRLRHLTADQLQQRGPHTYLRVGEHPVLLPPRLARLLQRLADQPQTRAMLTPSHPGPGLLFPGMLPGQPSAARAFTAKLARHGINVRAARNAALAGLAADLPAAILADLLGMHPQTAVRWVTYARRDWAEYLAIRAADRSTQP